MPSPTGYPDRESTLAAIQQTKLYGILDTGYSDPNDWSRLTEELIAGGTGILQIRAKMASKTELKVWTPPILAICRQYGIPLILNDYPHLAYELQVDGCHVGQDDMPLAEVRKILDSSQVVGKSTHSLQQAIDGEAEGADYIGFGPIFNTPTKPDYTPIGPEDIQHVYQRVKIPAFCIGGIKLENVEGLIRQHAQRVVIVSGLLLTDCPKSYAQQVVKKIPKLH